MRLLHWLTLCLSLSSALSVNAAEIDWPDVQAETLKHFVALLKIDTSNPPGNETQAANYLRDVLSTNAIESQFLGPNPERINLVARIKGNGKKRPILLMGHTDVVGVQAERWSVDPFGGVVKDGYIYGRGAVDDKDNVVANLMVFLLIKRMGVTLDRDVIFVAESGEEGFAPEGFRYLVNHHWDQIDAEFALGEGGGGAMRNGKPLMLSIAATEKVGRGVELVARGTSGHGSMPRPDNAVVHLAQAVAKIADWQPPTRLNEISRAYFQRIASVAPAAEAQRIRDLFDPRKAAAASEYFKQHNVRYNSILRTTISPNMFNAGFRSNVIPSQAKAYLDIRALADEDMEVFYDLMREVIDDPVVEIVPGRHMNPASEPSSLDTDMFRALEAVQEKIYPGAMTLPVVLTGGTDLQPLRGKGVHAYGIGPLKEESDGERNGAHADDERISAQALHDFVRYLWEVVMQVGA